MKQEFLNRFLNQLKLFDDDRSALKNKRGFHDATIDHFQLRSCGEYIKDVVRNGGFSLEDLKRHHIVNSSGDVSRQLLGRNILIPYMDRAGNVEIIKPHKFGLSGVPAHIFSGATFDRDAETLIITEGEFKAMAGYQYGFSIISLPGINVYSRKKYDELAQFVSNSIKLQKIIIMFDSETKDDPRFEKYKPDWKERYETVIYSYVMARKLAQSGYQTFIGLIPAEWRVNGKIDIDMCLAAGRSKQEMQSVLDNALTPQAYLDSLQASLDDKHFKFIKRRCDIASKPRIIIRRSSCYFASDPKDETKIGRQISNFVIDIDATYHGERLRRSVSITNEYGDKIPPVVLESEHMTSAHSFKKFLYERGNFYFDGTDAHLTAIWQYEFTCDEGNAIYEINHVGKVENSQAAKGKDVWITQNLMFYDDQIVEADDNNIFWVDGKGFRYLIADYENNGGDATNCQVPILSTQPMQMDEIIYHYSQLAGQAGKLLLGWAQQMILRTYIKTCGDIVPYPFVYGEKRTGKTTVCEHVMNLFGMPGFGTTFTDITKVAIQRLLGYYSSVPVWIDEFSNDPKTMSYEPHLKSVYNRVPVMKGTRSSFGIASYPVRSGLIMSGETIPSTDAVKQRAVLLPMKMNPTAGQSLKWLEDNKQALGWFMYWVLKNRKEQAKKVDEYIRNYYESLSAHVKDIDIRTLKHFSMMAGSYRALIGQKDDEFNDWLLRSVGKQMQTVERDEIYMFFEELSVLRNDGKLSNEFVKMEQVDGRKCIFIWFKGCYDKWREFYGKHHEIHAMSVLRETLNGRPYYIKEVRSQINKNTKRCVVMDYDTAPESLKDLAEQSLTEMQSAAMGIKSDGQNGLDF